MVEPSCIWFRTEYRDRLRNAQGTTFQDLFSDLMEPAYPRDFQRIRPYGNQGDQKCDGYLASTKTVLQVYAPRTMKQVQLIEKACGDFDGAVHHWADRMATWASGFAPIPKSALYPNCDRMLELCDSIRNEVGTEIEDGQLGRFLQA